MPTARKYWFGRSHAAGLIAAASVAILQACASGIGSAQAPEEIVKQRAEARWKALLARDWETAYNFSTPAYRSAIDLEGFRARLGGAVAWTGAQVLKVSCRESVCEPTIKVRFKPVLERGYPELDTEFSERWVLEDNRWWIHQKM